MNAPFAKDRTRRNEYTPEGRVKKGRIEGREIHWLADIDPGFTPDYSNIVRDIDGYMCYFTRNNRLGTVYRSSKIDDISGWLPETVCIPVKGRHALDAAALDNGRCSPPPSQCYSEGWNLFRYLFKSVFSLGNLQGMVCHDAKLFVPVDSLPRSLLGFSDVYDGRTCYRPS